MKNIFFVILAFVLLSFIKSDTNNWVQKAYYGGGSISESTSFTIGNYAYVGTGSNTSSLYSKKTFYRYDPSIDVWKRIADLAGSTRTSAIGFSINGKGYICGGLDDRITSKYYLTDTWEYNPETDLWYQRANFPRAGGIDHGTGFSIGSTAYVGLGWSNPSPPEVTGGFMNDFYKFAPDENKWTKLSDFPGAPRGRAFGFSMNGKGYVGLGMSVNNSLTPIYYKDFWEYDPSTDNWTRLPDFPGEGRSSSIGYGLDGFCYIGLGGINDFYKYDVSKKEWTSLNYLPGSVIGGISFSVGSKIYYGGGKSDLWEYATISSTLSLSATTLTIGATANSTKSFYITSNISWTASSDQAWLKINPTSGTGNANLTLTAEANTSATSRIATITISAPGLNNQSVIVTQNSSSTLLPNLIPYQPSGWSDKIVVSKVQNTNTDDFVTINDNIFVDWAFVNSGNADVTASINSKLYLDNLEIGIYSTASLPANYYSYMNDIQIGKLTVGNHTIKLSVDEQNLIVETDKTDNTYSKTFYVSATASNLSVSNSSLTIMSTLNSTATFDILSNIAWTVSSDQTWLSLSSASGSNNATITLTAQANPSTTTRTATVTVSGTGVTAQTITVTQDRASPFLTVSPTTLTIAAPASSTKTFDITSNTSWTTSSNQTWLTSSSASGSNNATITLSAVANPSTTTRTATVTVSGTGATAQTITVTQDGAASVLTVSTSNLTIAALANSTKTFDITSNISWTAASDQSWLSLSNASGSNNAIITLTAQSNPTTATRTAKISISGTGVTIQTTTVTQDAGTTGIIEIGNSNITIFPNPANETLFIKGLSQNSTIIILDINGKMLINKQITGNQIDVRKLAKGVYIIKITMDYETVTGRFIKE